jgi:hypothetical protein
MKMVDKKYFAFSQYSNAPVLQYSNNSRGGKKIEKGSPVGALYGFFLAI